MENMFCHMQIAQHDQKLKYEANNHVTDQNSISQRFHEKSVTVTALILFTDVNAIEHGNGINNPYSNRCGDLHSVLTEFLTAKQYKASESKTALSHKAVGP